jgi:hypothetical protein
MDMLDERLRRAADLVSPPEPSLTLLVHRRDRRSRNRRIAAAVAALVVTLGGLGGAVLGLSGLAGRETRPGSGTSSVPAGAEPPRPLRGGEYFYERTVTLLPKAFGLAGGRVTEETWWATDGSGRRTGVSTTADYGLGPRGMWGPGQMAVEDLSGLSFDPAVLRDQLTGRSAPGGASPQPAGTPGFGVYGDSARLWRASHALLEMPNAEPALRAALFEVAASIPEVEMHRDVQDPVGRPAVSVSTSVGDGLVTMFFDPATLQLLAIVEDYGEDTAWYRIVEAAGVVRSTEETPKRDQLLVPPPEQPPSG